MFLDLYPRIHDFQHEVLAGLQLPQKRISPKFFYDRRGSEIFERICGAPEYYPTRTELRILEEFCGEIVDCLADDTALFEFGSGASLKTRVLLSQCEAAGRRLSSYVPIDISRDFLKASAEELARGFPKLRILPVCADYTRPIYLPASFLNRAQARAAFFPGSTIGNLDPSDATEYLRNTAKLIRAGGKLIIGVDLIKDRATLEAAYNDSQGWTEAFNKNLIVRMNAELEAGIPLESFEHFAFYNADRSRIEMHLRSRSDQEVVIAGCPIRFRRNETIHTENSYKYSEESFGELVHRAGFEVEARFTDRDRLFAVFVLRASAASQEIPDLTRIAA